MINVTINTPESINKNEETTIEAHVTQGDENVDDANEVKFEIWRTGKDDHEMLKGKHTGNGIYVVKKSFKENGTYFIVSHVTARDMHSMPSRKVIVGDPGTLEKTPPQENGVKETNDHHSHNNVSILLEKSEPLVANKETTLSVVIKNKGKLLSKAHVRLEIWKENEKIHEYVDVPEENGLYKLKYLFASQGSYHIKVHVNKNDELHEHIQEIVEVN